MLKASKKAKQNELERIKIRQIELEFEQRELFMYEKWLEEQRENDMSDDMSLADEDTDDEQMHVDEEQARKDVEDIEAAHQEEMSNQREALKDAANQRHQKKIKKKMGNKATYSTHMKL